MKRRQFPSVIASILLPSLLHAGDERQVEVAKQGGFVPKIADASPEAENSIKSFKVIPELNLRLWAAEPLLANPVAFATDEKGRWYVAETFRLHAGVSDIRAHMDWLDADGDQIDDRFQPGPGMPMQRRAPMPLAPVSAAQPAVPQQSSQPTASTSEKNPSKKSGLSKKSSKKSSKQQKATRKS